MDQLFLLLILYQAKHYVADYPLQTPYMLGKFKPFPDCVKPLAAHAAVHGGLTLGIALFFVSLPVAALLALMDALVHGVVDYVKANPSLGGRYNALSKSEMRSLIITQSEAKKAAFETECSEHYRLLYSTELVECEKKLDSNRKFWYALGADQLAHHLTHYLIIYFLVR